MCPGASADARRFLGGRSWVPLHSAASLESESPPPPAPPTHTHTQSAGLACKSRKVEHKYKFSLVFQGTAFRQPELPPDWLLSPAE